MRITPSPVQKPLPFYIASFSKTSLDMAAKRGLNIIYAPFAAGMVFGGLDKAVASYREACDSAGKTPGRAMCSYFIFIADDAKAEDYGRERQMRLLQPLRAAGLPAEEARTRRRRCSTS